MVLKPAQAPAIAAPAIQMQENEIKLLARLAAGEKLPDITGARAMVEAKLAPRHLNMRAAEQTLSRRPSP